MCCHCCRSQNKGEVLAIGKNLLSLDEMLFVWENIIAAKPHHVSVEGVVA